jgi:CubicO group peptidase (beta-lactamase class C family)
LALGTASARAEDKLLAEAVDFTGTFIYLGAKPPAFVIGAIRNGETVVRGFGEIAKGSGKEPDGDTLMRVGSITKVFCGATLASMVADGTVGFADKLQDRLGWDVKIPERDGKSIRLIDLATHASGLPREAKGHRRRMQRRTGASRITSVRSRPTPCCSTRGPACSTRISVSICWRRPWPMPEANLTLTSSRSGCSIRPGSRTRASI